MLAQQSDAPAAQIVLRHIEAFNARDVENDPWSADAEMIGPHASASGRDAVLGFQAAFWEAFPDGRLELSHVLGDGEAAAAEGVFSGRHDGPLRSPEGEVSPTGRSISFRWAAVYGVRGDELISEHLFFDQIEFLGQLGLLPDAEAQPAS